MAKRLTNRGFTGAWRLRRATLAAAFIVGGGCGPNGGGPQPSIGVLNFYTGQSLDAPSLIESRIFGPGGHVAFGTDNLTTILTDHSLPIHVTLTGPTPRTEALIFALDPEVQRANLEQSGFVSFITTDVSPWDNLTRTGSGSNPNGGLPMTWPPAFSLEWQVNGAEVGSADITPSSYFSAFDQHPEYAAGPWLFPSGQGSVKSAYTYDHGACSREEALQPQIQTALDDLSSALGGQGFPVESVYVNWVRIANFLEHHDPDPFSLSGGFYVNANVVVNIAFVGDEPINILAKYVFGRDPTSGTIFVAFPELLYDFEPCASAGGEPDCPVRAQLYAATGKANTTISALQHVDVFGPTKDTSSDPTSDVVVAPSVIPGQITARECSLSADISSDDGCGQQITLIADLAHDGAVAIGLSQTDATVVQNTTANPKNWSCHVVQDIYPCKNGTGPDCAPSCPLGAKCRPSSETHQRCEYFVPAKRLNPFPDTIEAVWFDGTTPDFWSANELQNPAFAVFAALSSPLVQANVTPKTNPITNDLCTFQMRNGFYANLENVRQWVSLGIPPGYAQ